MRESTKQCAKCALIRLETATAEILEFGWNNQEQLLIVPTKAATTIVNSVLQVNRAICDLASREDLKLILRDTIGALNEAVFDQIKSKLIITKQSAYELLCDEIDYLYDNLREFFFEKNAMSVETLRLNVEEIKHIKKVLLSN